MQGDQVYTRGERNVAHICVWIDLKESCGIVKILENQTNVLLGIPLHLSYFTSSGIHVARVIYLFIIRSFTSILDPM